MKTSASETLKLLRIFVFSICIKPSKRRLISSATFTRNAILSIVERRFLSNIEEARQSKRLNCWPSMFLTFLWYPQNWVQRVLLVEYKPCILEMRQHFISHCTTNRALILPLKCVSSLLSNFCYLSINTLVWIFTSAKVIGYQIFCLLSDISQLETYINSSWFSKRLSSFRLYGPIRWAFAQARRECCQPAMEQKTVLL